MPRVLLTVAALLAIAVAVATPRVPVSPTPARPTVASARPAFVPVLFRRHFRTRGFGSGYGYYRTRRRHPLLRHIVHTAIGLYLLHLFFSHGGLSILLWVVIIALVVAFLRRRRRPYAG